MIPTIGIYILLGIGYLFSLWVIYRIIRSERYYALKIIYILITLFPVFGGFLALWVANMPLRNPHARHYDNYSSQSIYNNSNRL